MSVEVGEVRLVLTSVGAFILATAVVAQEGIRHTWVTQVLAAIWTISALATLVEAWSLKND